MKHSCHHCGKKFYPSDLEVIERRISRRVIRKILLCRVCRKKGK